MNWYLAALNKYAVFEGRARRKEYWLFSLFHTLAICVLAVIGGVAAAAGGDSAGGVALFGLIGLYVVATLLPSLAVYVRRLHDTGKSAWWLLLSLVPFGGLVLLIFLLLDSDPGPNRYGDNPKAAGGGTTLSATVGG